MKAISRNFAVTSLLVLAGFVQSGHAEGFPGAGPNAVTRSASTYSTGIRPDFRERSRHHAEYRAGYEQRHRFHRQDVVGGDGIPSYVRGVGTFSGDQSVARFRHNGTYYSAQAFGYPALPAQTINFIAPKAKVIVVAPAIEIGKPKSGCAMEHGVCVIRGAP